jgi:hypothetical protein
LNTPHEDVLRLVIIIPHRDADRPVEEYRRGLFAAGLAGAYSFPVAVPLAVAARPFSKDELGALARELRDLSAAGGRDGKFHAGGTGFAPLPRSGSFFDGLAFFGPVLRFSSPEAPGVFPEDAAGLGALNREKVLYRFPGLVLCAALAGQADRELLSGAAGNLPEAPEFSFRAAMAVNLSIRPLGSGEPGYSFEWKTGAPVWLPAFRHFKKRGKTE